MKTLLQPGKLVSLRGREWVVLPSDDPENLLIVKPLGGSDDEMNLVTLCWRCHAEAHGTFLPERHRAPRTPDPRPGGRARG